MYCLRSEDRYEAVHPRVAQQAGFSCLVFTGRPKTSHDLPGRIECQVRPDFLRMQRQSDSCYSRVWKVGVSLLGLLTPAGPPPQRHGAGSHNPYRVLDFRLTSPEEAMMTAAAQLEWLTMEWLEERRVKISIRQTALTFSVM